jgi:hypothetical protein
VTLQIVASLIDAARGVIYDRHMFIVQATRRCPECLIWHQLQIYKKTLPTDWINEALYFSSPVGHSVTQRHSTSPSFNMDGVKKNFSFIFNYQFVLGVSSL